MSIAYFNALEDIIRRTAEECHSSEKQLRMESAAATAESVALANMEPVSTKASTGPPPVPTSETPAATYNGGRVYLKGNPIESTPEIICSHCKLPRLPYPIKGRGSRPPDLSKEYCKLYPFVQDTAHDIYGNPFPTDMAKSKKERDLLKQQQKNAEKDSVGTPGSQDTEMGNTANGGAGPGEPAHAGREIKLDTGGKPASYVPWHTCPSCKRSLLITRFAQHLEKCLGISGRQSSRNAMAKMNSQNGNGNSNTPLGGSRLGTPTPGNDSFVRIKSKLDRTNTDDGDGGLDETPEKKKKKKSSYIKKADRERMQRESLGVNNTITSSAPLKVKLKANGLGKDREGSLLERKASFAESAASERSEKRDRDRDENDEGQAPKAKKLKLSLGRSDGSLSEVKDGGGGGRKD